MTEESASKPFEGGYDTPSTYNEPTYPSEFSPSEEEREVQEFCNLRPPEILKGNPEVKSHQRAKEGGGVFSPGREQIYQTLNYWDGEKYVRVSTGHNPVFPGPTNKDVPSSESQQIEIAKFLYQLPDIDGLGEALLPIKSNWLSRRIRNVSRNLGLDPEIGGQIKHLELAHKSTAWNISARLFQDAGILPESAKEKFENLMLDGMVDMKGSYGNKGDPEEEWGSDLAREDKDELLQARFKVAMHMLKNAELYFQARVTSPANEDSFSEEELLDKILTGDGIHEALQKLGLDKKALNGIISIVSYDTEPFKGDRKVKEKEETVQNEIAALVPIVKKEAMLMYERIRLIHTEMQKK